LLLYFVYQVCIKKTELKTALVQVREMLKGAQSRQPPRMLVAQRYTVDSHGEETHEMCAWLLDHIKSPAEVGDTWTMMGPHVSHWVPVCKRCERMQRGLRVAKHVLGGGMCEQCYTYDGAQGRPLPVAGYLQQVRKLRLQLVKEIQIDDKPF